MQELITHVNFAKGFRGGERQTQLLIEELSRLGHRQRLLVRKKSELTSRCTNLINLEIIEIAKPYIFGINYVKGSSIIHAHETKALQFAYFANLFTNIPFIVTRRVDNKIKNNFLNKKMYLKAKTCVVLSNAIKKEILKVSSHTNITIIPSAYTNVSIDKKKSQAIKERFKSKFLVGNIGALDDKHKGQSFLIQAAREIEKLDPNIHFILVGRGADEVKLKELAKGLSNITFEGFVNNVNDYINALDLFVFPSRNEGLGSILFDVMQLNVPIIASNVGGIPDIIQNEFNGVLIPALNSNSIKEQVLRLLKEADLREKFTRNAQLNIANYAPSKMAQSYIKTYKTSLVTL